MGVGSIAARLRIASEAWVNRAADSQLWRLWCDILACLFPTIMNAFHLSTHPIRPSTQGRQNIDRDRGAKRRGFKILIIL